MERYDLLGSELLMMPQGFGKWVKYSDVAKAKIKLNIEAPHIEDEWFGPIYQCKNCAKVEIWDKFNYCPGCGVEIEWEGKE